MMPDIWLISVVLPAPFGPMMACISPGMTSSVTSSVTTRLPKLLRKPSRRSTGSGMTGPPPEPDAKGVQTTDQPAAREQHDQHQDRPENRLPVFRYAGQPFFGQKISGSANERTVERTGAAEDHHDDQLAGFLPRHVSGRDKLGQ